MITIRKATAQDVGIAWNIRNAAINNQCVGHYPSETLRIWTEGNVPEQFTREILGNGFLATGEGAIVGAGIINLETGKIDGMFVHPDQMGKGVGKRIMSHLEDLARKAGLKRLHLESSLNAVNFYRSCGFSGNEVSEYRSPKGITLDCILMAKRL